MQLQRKALQNAQIFILNQKNYTGHKSCKNGIISTELCVCESYLLNLEEKHGTEDIGVHGPIYYHQLGRRGKIVEGESYPS